MSTNGLKRWLRELFLRPKVVHRIWMPYCVSCGRTDCETNVAGCGKMDYRGWRTVDNDKKRP